MSIRSACFILCALLGTAPVWATVYELPVDGSSVIGTDEHVKSTYQDTLLDIARRYSLGYEEIIRANPGTDLWIPGEGKDILLPGQRILPPGPREGIVVNIPEHRLYYYPKPKKNEKPVVITFPVSIGKMDWHTPLGQTHVIQKIKHPAWYPPESVRKEHEANGDPLPKFVPAGPDNPLGDYAMRLAVGDGAYMIHGTNNPMAVGMAVTHGCIRMYPEDVASLFPLIPVGTKVYLINEPVKTAFADGKLLLEVHPPVDAQGQSTEPDMQLLSERLDKALGSTTAAIHWDFARQALQAATGMPVVVGLEADLPDAPAPGSATAGPTADASTAPGATAPAPGASGSAAPANTAAADTGPAAPANAAPAGATTAATAAPAGNTAADAAPSSPSTNAIAAAPPAQR
ncbi:MAG TPA: L,D-transpeptidase family protein [Steroidobacteraceae bacterium]|nr:L,D-transpeptidase family protein [Steroidobacteraceae bacterium]